MRTLLNYRLWPMAGAPMAGAPVHQNIASFPTIGLL